MKISKERYEIKLVGIVQGVGFRPYVYNQAFIFNINGWVTNQGSALFMDIEGERKAVKDFLIKVIKMPPNTAVIEKVKVVKKNQAGYENFIIKPSSESENEIKFIPRDIAICDECISEILNEADKRYHYPFTNCTKCGPRYSIIKKMPYDRENTKMDTFNMCQTCKNEYEDKNNRRFHAQTNCCSDCGPILKLLDHSGKELICDDVIKKSMELIKEGKIAAIKGLGGFHLVCDAENKNSVSILRNRKNRPDKPFAIMVKDIENAKQLAFIGDEEEKLLLGNKKPIVILQKKENSLIADNIAPNMKKLGIMLPYTPLHYLLFQFNIPYLVMTSGNLSSSPIQYENKEAIKRLGKIADYFVIHNREINNPVEDSVVKVVDKREIVIRRGRGYAPYIFDAKINKKILALGAEEKGSFCISQNGYMYMSQYLGDLKDYDGFANYERAIVNFKNLLEEETVISVHDLNLSFLSSKHAEYEMGKKVLVQHHHAHMVSCMVENNLFCSVIGVIFDGTGLGTDRNIWGGEFLVGTRKNFIRAGHLKYVTIQGGDKSIKEPWRIAVSYLHSINYDVYDIFTILDIDKDEIDSIIKALNMKVNCYNSSSMGRFFDCIAAILNIRKKNTYDAQAAIELENTLEAFNEDYYEYRIEEENGIYQICYESIICGVLEDIKKRIKMEVISAKFHNTIVNSSIELVNIISKKYNIKNIVLSGGVFENNYLLCNILNKLRENKFLVYYNQQIPTNDSGICAGQLAIADVTEGD